MGRWDREWKSEARKVANYSGRQPKTAILLPGEDLQFAGLDNGETFLFCIEKKPAIADSIRKHLVKKKLKEGENFFIWSNEAKAISFHNNGILKGRYFDYSFLDFCNQMNRDLLNWILAEGGSFRNEVSLTFSAGIRNNTLFPSNVLKTRFDAGLSLFYCIDVENTHFGNTTELSLDAKATVGLVWAALSKNHGWRCTDIFYYRDTSPMVMVKFKESPASPKIPHYETIRSLKQSDKSILTTLGHDHNESDWQRIGCHKLMKDSLKKRYVAKAKQGECPPWLDDYIWELHAMNPNRTIRRRVS